MQLCLDDRLSTGYTSGTDSRRRWPEVRLEEISPKPVVAQINIADYTSMCRLIVCEHWKQPLC